MKIYNIFLEEEEEINSFKKEISEIIILYCILYPIYLIIQIKISS